MRNFMNVRNIISYFSVFTLLVTILDIVLTLLVYYLMPTKLETFLDMRWTISIGFVGFGIATNKITIDF